MIAMKELKLQAEIDKCIGELVQLGERIIGELGNKVCKVEASQIRNVMAVANSAPHPAIVTNFIRYQMGRKGSPGEAWKDTGLGEKVITAIDKDVRRLAKQAAGNANGDVDEVQARMVRLFLGFMNRCHVYEYDRLCPSKGADQAKEERKR